MSMVANGSQQQPPDGGAALVKGVLLMGLRGWAQIVGLHTCCGFGSRTLAVHGLAGVVVVALWAGFGQSPALLTRLLPICLALQLAHRIHGAILRRRSGAVIHSWYMGDFVFARWLPGWSPRTLEGLELVLGMLVGVAYAAALGDPQLLAFFWLGAFVRRGLAGWWEVQQRSREQDAHDARIEAQYQMERLRHRR